MKIIEQDVLDPSVLKSAVPTWHSIDDVVCVFCDLKNSTKLSLRHDPTTRSRP